jgi:hypothetical protein
VRCGIQASAQTAEAACPAQIKVLDCFAHITLQAFHRAHAILALRVAGLRQHEDEEKRRAEEGEARESSLTPQNRLSAYSCGCIRSVALKYFLA